MSSDAVGEMEEDDNGTARCRSSDENRGDGEVAEEERCTPSGDRPLMCSAGSTLADRVACSESSKDDAAKVSGGRSLPAMSDIPSACETSEGDRSGTVKQIRKSASFSYDARKRPQKSKVDGTKSQFLPPSSEIQVAGEESDGISAAVVGIIVAPDYSSVDVAPRPNCRRENSPDLAVLPPSQALVPASSVACPKHWVAGRRRILEKARAGGKVGLSASEASCITFPDEIAAVSGHSFASEKQKLAQHRWAASSMQSTVRAEKKQECPPLPPPSAAPILVQWVPEKQNLVRSQRVKQTKADPAVVPPVNRSSSFDNREELPHRSPGVGDSSGDDAAQLEEVTKESAEPSGGSAADDTVGTVALSPPVPVTPPVPTGAQSSSQPPTALNNVSPGAVHVPGIGSVRSSLGSISSASNQGNDVVVEVAAQLAPGEEAAALEGHGPLRSGTALVLEGVPVPSPVGGEGQRPVSDGRKEGCSAFSFSRCCANLMCTAVAVVLSAATIAIAAVLLGGQLGSSAGTSEHSVPDPRQEPDPILEIISRLSSAEALNDTQSPQHWAFHWLMEEDGPFSASTLKDDPPHLLQRYALVVLYYSTGGPHWRYQPNFLSSDHECEWNKRFVGEWPKGVMFCNNNSQVVTIDLSSNNLTGTLPGRELAAFPSLERLRMYDNNLDGTIPSELASLDSLQIINLKKNGLTGPIIENIGDLQNLVYLNMGENKLDSTIPLSMGYLKALEFLSLDENMLSGEIPSTIGSMSSLELLNLNFNHLSSTVPPSWNSLAKLERLHVMGNSLNGTLSIVPAGNQNLMQLIAGDNNFTGTIPTSLGALPQLTVLLLENNQLHGSIPESLSNLMELEVLSLGSNNLVGTLSAAIFRSETLRAIGVGNNKLTGTLPNDIGNPSGMLVVSAEQNLLTGTIPWTYGNLPALKALSLHSNLLSGAIPSSLGNNTESLGLMLENNVLNGTVPESLAKLEKAIWISLARNDLAGNLSFVCAPEPSNAQLVTADCGPPDIEVSCDCCICCNDAVGGCDFSLDLKAYVLSCLVDGSCNFWGDREKH